MPERRRRNVNGVTTTYHVHLEFDPETRLAMEKAKALRGQSIKGYAEDAVRAQLRRHGLLMDLPMPEDFR